MTSGRSNLGRSNHVRRTFVTSWSLNASYFMLEIYSPVVDKLPQNGFQTCFACDIHVGCSLLFSKPYQPSIVFGFKEQKKNIPSTPKRMVLRVPCSGPTTTCGCFWQTGISPTKMDKNGCPPEVSIQIRASYHRFPHKSDHLRSGTGVAARSCPSLSAARQAHGANLGDDSGMVYCGPETWKKAPPETMV